MSFEELFSRRSYYLLVALTSEGQLIFEEDREGSAYGVRLNDRNFLNGARHSVYYVRDNNTATLLVSYNFLSFEFWNKANYAIINLYTILDRP